MAAWYEKVGKGIGKGFAAVGDTLGLTDDSDQATDQYNERGVAYEGQDASRFDITKAANYNDANQALHAQQAQGDRIRDKAVGNLQTETSAPRTMLTGQVNAPNQVSAAQTQTSTNNFQAGMDRAGQARNEQLRGLATMEQAAAGQGPSLAPGMMRENAANASAAFGTAGSQANQGYSQASTQANQAYGDAAAAQQAAAQQAATAGNRMLADAAAANLKSQAALAASARGGNAGAAILNAQNNSALGNAQAQTNAARAYTDQMRGATEQAGAAARQASAQQQAQMAQLQATAERAGIEAARALEAGDARAAQLASQEQQHAMDQVAAINNEMRSQDLEAAALGSQVDQMMQAGDIANADRLLKAQGMNADMAFQAGQISAENAIEIARMNGDWSQAANALNADVQKYLAGLGAQMDANATQGFMTLVQQGLEAGMTLEASKQQAFESAQERGIRFDLGAVNAGNDARGQNIGLVEKGADAVGKIASFIGLSDKRTKRILGPAEIPDFRAATPSRYEYLEEWQDDPRAGDDEFEGPMADDLPEGTYEEDEDGYKQVNAVRLALALASAMGDVQERLDALDGEDDDGLESIEDEDEDDPSTRLMMSLLGGKAA